MQPFPNPVRPKQKINAQSFSAKFSSKRECYFFLTVEVGAYLCSVETLTIYFLKELVQGTKKRKHAPLP